MKYFLSFILNGQCFAIDLAHVERVAGAVQFTQLPNPPEFVVGAINVHGNVIPVIDLRKVFCMPVCDLELSDQFIICAIEGKSFAVWVQQVKGIESYHEKDLIPAQEALPDLDLIDYVYKQNGGITLIVNLGRMLLKNKSCSKA